MIFVYTQYQMHNQNEQLTMMWGWRLRCRVLRLEAGRRRRADWCRHRPVVVGSRCPLRRGGPLSKRCSEIHRPTAKLVQRDLLWHEPGAHCAVWFVRQVPLVERLWWRFLGRDWYDTSRRVRSWRLLLYWNHYLKHGT